MLKVEPVSRVPDGPGYYSPPIHFCWAQNGQHVLEEEEEVACCVAAFLNPSFTQSPYVSRERAFPQHVGHGFKVLTAKLTMCLHTYTSLVEVVSCDQAICTCSLDKHMDLWWDFKLQNPPPRCSLCLC